MLAFPPLDNQSGSAEDPQLLGDIRLALASQHLQVADAGFPAGQDRQELQAGWLGKDLKKSGKIEIWLR